MRRRLFIAVTVLCWALLMAWLVRYEAFPERFGDASIGYRDYFARGLMVMDHWMIISFNGRRIGYSHTQIDVDEASLGQQTLIHNQTLLRMKIMDQVQMIRVSAQAMLDAMHNMQSFNFILGSRGFFVNINGLRLKNQLFKVDLHSTGGDQKLTLTIPDDAMLYSPMTQLALRKLEPGRQLRLRTFNPATMGLDNVVVRAVRREPLQVGGLTYRTVLLAVDYHGFEVKSWIDLDEGQMLRQETPMGWVLEASTPEDALGASTGDAGGGDDMLTAMAVPSSKPIPDPRASRKLVIWLRGPGLTNLVPVTHRQIVNRVVDSGTELTLMADTVPPPMVAPVLGDALRRLTNATVFIQSGHPRIMRMARSITASASNSVDAALAINAWVNANVKKVTTASLPSALDVLAQREGDCNEHTYLAVALARASGLPAKVMVGLVYHKGAFYYHAWPAIHVGRWLEMDPTLGEAAVDATHIALLEGELEDQMKLMNLLGRLQVELVEDRPQAAKKATP